MAYNEFLADRIEQEKMSMRFINGSLIVMLIFGLTDDCTCQAGFKQEQLAYPRVRHAYEEAGDWMDSMLTDHQIDNDGMELYLRAFKQEKEIEVWARNKGDSRYIKLQEYKVCRTSGTLGPKRQQGDLQIPEGFYHVAVFNPASSFHLSMCINYPNRSDRILGVQGNLGGNICIHGSCVTIGCLPLTDHIIKQLYILCVEAKNGGQSRIPVTIYPVRMTPLNFTILSWLNSKSQDNLNLWADLRTEYEHFQSTNEKPGIIFLDNGQHRIND